VRTFSPQYEERVETTFRQFVKPGDSVMCIALFALEGQSCQVCGKEGIKWNYVIENLRSHELVVAGSECIRNYEIILSRWGFEPRVIVFPTSFEWFTRYLVQGDEGNPRAVEVHDRFLGVVGITGELYLKSLLRDKAPTLLKYLVLDKTYRRPVVREKLPSDCPRCADELSDWHCSICAGKGLRCHKDNIDQLCPRCAMVALCPECGGRDNGIVIKEPPGKFDDVPF
jgi:hypothetical protein